MGGLDSRSVAAAGTCCSLASLAVLALWSKARNNGDMFAMRTNEVVLSNGTTHIRWRAKSVLIGRSCKHVGTLNSKPFLGI